MVVYITYRTAHISEVQDCVGFDLGGFQYSSHLDAVRNCPCGPHLQPVLSDDLLLTDCKYEVRTDSLTVRLKNRGKGLPVWRNPWGFTSSAQRKHV